MSGPCGTFFLCSEKKFLLMVYKLHAQSKEVCVYITYNINNQDEVCVRS